MIEIKVDDCDSQGAMKAIHTRFYGPRLEVQRFSRHQKTLFMAWMPRIQAILKKEATIIDSEPIRDTHEASGNP